MVDTASGTRPSPWLRVRPSAGWSRLLGVRPTLRGHTAKWIRGKVKGGQSDSFREISGWWCHRISAWGPEQPRTVLLPEGSPSFPWSRSGMSKPPTVTRQPSPPPFLLSLHTEGQTKERGSVRRFRPSYPSPVTPLMLLLCPRDPLTCACLVFP